MIVQRRKGIESRERWRAGFFFFFEFNSICPSTIFRGHFVLLRLQC